MANEKSEGRATAGSVPWSAFAEQNSPLIYRRAAAAASCLPRAWNKRPCLDNAGLNSYKGNCLPHSLVVCPPPALPAVLVPAPSSKARGHRGEGAREEETVISSSRQSQKWSRIKDTPAAPQCRNGQGLQSEVKLNVSGSSSSSSRAIVAGSTVWSPPLTHRAFFPSTRFRKSSSIRQQSALSIPEIYAERSRVQLMHWR